MEISQTHLNMDVSRSYYNEIIIDKVLRARALGGQHIPTLCNCKYRNNYIYGAIWLGKSRQL